MKQQWRLSWQVEQDLAESSALLGADRGDVEKVVPPTRQAHLDRVAPQLGMARRQPDELGDVSDDPTTWWHAGSEHEAGDTQLVLSADRTVVPRPLRAVATDTEQFRLSVADIAVVELSRPVAVQQAPTREPVVDRTRCGPGTSAGLRREERHGCPGYSSGAPDQPRPDRWPPGPRPSVGPPPD